jgi:hypothetical protein
MGYRLSAPTIARRSSSVPRFADPWRFRKSPPLPREVPVGPDGTPLMLTYVRHNGVWRTVPRAPQRSSRPRPPVRSLLHELRRRKSATFSRYRASGWFTPTELATTEALWFEGLSLRALARREGVAPSAISTRLAGLFHKAPEFSRWWRLKHTMFRRSARD